MKKVIFKCVIKFLVAIAAFGVVTMLLWNALLPSILGVASINIWQAFGLLVLTRLLFGGMNADMMMHKSHDHFHHVHDKWKKMTPEQQKQFIQERRHFRFGYNPFGQECFGANEQEKSKKEDGRTDGREEC